MLAYGVVFVLLLGEIDLSIGYLAGVGRLIVAELQLPGAGHANERPPRDLVAVGVCAAIGGCRARSSRSSGCRRSSSRSPAC